MAVKFRSRITGGLSRALDQYTDKVKDSIIFTGAAAGARLLYEEVKLNTSGLRSTGEPGGPPGRKPPGILHNAVYRVYSPERSQDGVKTYRVSVNKAKARHWYLVEYGSSRSPAYPYLRPAADRIPDAIKAAKDAMRDRLRKG